MTLIKTSSKSVRVCRISIYFKYIPTKIYLSKDDRKTLQTLCKLFHLKKKENISSLENSCMVVEAWLMHNDMKLSQTPLEETEWFPTDLTWAWLKSHWILFCSKSIFRKDIYQHQRVIYPCQKRSWQGIESKNTSHKSKLY